MAKITLTRNNKYVETGFTVNVTGTSLKNKKVVVEYADAKYGAETWSRRATTRTITNNTSYSFSYTPSTSLVNNLYADCYNSTELRLNIYIEDSSGVAISNYSFITLLNVIPPDFEQTPVYRVTDSRSLSLTNNNQIIINGMSTVEVSNIRAVEPTSVRQADIEYIEINNTLYKYDTYFVENKVVINKFKKKKNESNVWIRLIDTRGVDGGDMVLEEYQDIISYHKPIIKDLIVERDGISTTTKLTARGVYTEGYRLGAEPIIPSYKYQEITSDGSGIINRGNTVLTTLIEKTPTSEFVDYNSILDEYDNFHGDGEGGEYYEKSVWDNLHIGDLFETATLYNNKYTQEYLQNDYDSVNQRYYIKSGGYNSWLEFWRDTLSAIQKVMYGTYVYGEQDKDYGNGGNYEFEIETTTIEGDLLEGFTLDKTFNIWFYINDNDNPQGFWYDETTNRKEILPTAIPAIDVYKDKVALHGLFDETISDSDVQFWGNVFLNGYNLENIVSNTVYKGNINLGKIGIEWGTVEVTPSSGSGTNYYGSERVDFENTYASSPGFFANAGIGSTAIKNVSTLNPSRTYGSVWISTTNNDARVCRYFVIGVLADNE